MSIFEAFELEDMLWYYRYWKKQAGSRAWPRTWIY
jgi:hypothetical protein